MTRSPRLAVVALSAVMALTATPLTALAQGSSPVASEEPVTSASPMPQATPSTSASVAPIASPASPGTSASLAEVSVVPSTEQICDWSGGTLDADVCSLPAEPLVQPQLVKAFGPDLELSVVAAAGAPVALSDPAPEDGPVVSSVSFSSAVELDGGLTKWLNQQQRNKDKSVIKSRKTKWNKLDQVGLVSLQLAEPINTRKRSEGGVVVVRLQHGDKTIDLGFEDRKPIFRNGRGRDTDGLAIVRDDRVDIFVPGGLDGPFDAELVMITGDGLATGQSIGGPGGTDALIPTEPYAPVLACGAAFAGVDPADTSDGETFGLGSMTYTFVTPRIPDGVGDVQPTFTLTLAANGSRAGDDAPDLVYELTPEPSMDPGATTLSIDLSDEGFADATGYHIGEIPFTLTGMSASLAPGGSAPGFDPDVARALLEEAGWVDADRDGVFEADLGDVALEMNRITGGGFTETPIAWGWTGCGKDAHWASVQNPCRQPLDDQLRDALGSVVNEDPTTLFAQSGSFASGFTGCTIFGEGEVFAATWLLEDVYGQGTAYDPLVLAPFVEQLGCDVAAEAPGEGLRLVGSCADPAFEIFRDDSEGFGSYFAFAGSGLDVARLEQDIVKPIKDGDVDGDGVTDRFDPDIDGDGLLNVVDDDDDGDTVPDSQDWSSADPASYVSPTAFSSLLQSLGVNG